MSRPRFCNRKHEHGEEWCEAAKSVRLQPCPAFARRIVWALDDQHFEHNTPRRAYRFACTISERRPPARPFMGGPAVPGVFRNRGSPFRRGGRVRQGLTAGIRSDSSGRSESSVCASRAGQTNRAVGIDSRKPRRYVLAKTPGRSISPGLSANVTEPGGERRPLLGGMGSAPIAAEKRRRLP